MDQWIDSQKVISSSRLTVGRLSRSYTPTMTVPLGRTAGGVLVFPREFLRDAQAIRDGELRRDPCLPRGWPGKYRI